MRYRYLTFDCYGTLIDWRAGIENELKAVAGDLPLGGQNLLESYGLSERKEEATYRKYREVLRRSVLSMSRDLGASISDEAARRFAASVPRWPAFSDTGKFLRDMGSRGYKRFILSNVDDDLLRGTIENNGLEVDGYVTAEQVESYKPNPGHWVEFLRRTGAEKDEVIHVAQSLYHDIAPAQGLGIDSAWVNRYGEPIPRGVSPMIIADSLAGLSEALD